MPDQDGGAPAAQTEPAQQGFLGRFGGLFLEALPALVSAVGFLGFVALIGGVIHWIRFSAAELPATTAVRLIPREDLIAEGAVSMVIWFGLGLLAVLMVYLLDRGGNASRPTRYGLAVIVIVELAITVVSIELDAWAYGAAGVWLLAVLILLFGSLERLANKWRVAGRSERRDVDAAIAAVTARRIERDAAAAGLAALVDAPDSSPQAEQARKRLLDAEAALREAEGERVVALDRWFIATDYKSVPEAVRDAYATGAKDPWDAAPGWPTAREHRARRKLADPPSDEGTKAIVGRHWAALRRWLGRHRSRWITVPLGLVLLVLGAWFSYGEPDEEVWGVELWPVLSVAAAVAFASSGSTVLIGVSLLLVGIVFVAAYDPTSWLAIMLCIVVLLGAANLGVARATSRFAWYGASVFLSIALFGAALTAVDTIRTPEVQPAALVRKSDEKAMCGVYITQTKDRVYLGRVELESPDGDRAEANSGRIFWVKADEVDVLTIGRLQPIRKADPKAQLLRLELYDDRPQLEPPALKATTTKRTDSRTQKVKVETTTELPADAELYPTTRRKPPDPGRLCTTVNLAN
jgi:hypothetical protein